MADEYFVGQDGHVLSESEHLEASRLDEPVSTEGAPDTRGAHVESVTIERNQKMIHTYERAIARDEAELGAETDEFWKAYLEGNIALNRRRIAELEAEIRVPQSSVRPMTASLPTPKTTSRPLPKTKSLPTPKTNISG